MIDGGHNGCGGTECVITCLSSISEAPRRATSDLGYTHAICGYLRLAAVPSRQSCPRMPQSYCARCLYSSSISSSSSPQGGGRSGGRGDLRLATVIHLRLARFVRSWHCFSWQPCAIYGHLELAQASLITPLYFSHCGGWGTREDSQGK